MADLPTETEEKPETGLSGSVAGHLPDAAVHAVSEALDENRIDEVREYVEFLHHAEVADLIERLPGDKRDRLVGLLSDDFDPNVMAELDETVLDGVVDQLGLDQVAQVVAGMDSDDAVDVVEELEDHEQREVLDALSEADRTLIEEGLSYPEDSAGRLMQRETVAVPSHWTVGQAIDYMRETEDLTTHFFDLYLVDPRHQPVGTIPLSRVLRTQRHVALNAIMSVEIRKIPVTMDQEEVAFLFRQRDLISAPVIDEANRLVGVITVDDVVDVIHEEHEEDIMRLAGVGEEDDLYAAIWATVRSRSTWLFIHLIAAGAAAAVVGIFRGTIEQMVALAILMPVVAAMGGTASVQTLTVAVRAIAMRELTPANAFRTVGKEIIVGFANGILFAVMIGLATWAWFGSLELGGVIGLAIIINLVVAGLAGSALPVVLQRMGFDPAVAGSALLTSITDVVGFYVFLGLAALLLL